MEIPSTCTFHTCTHTHTNTYAHIRTHAHTRTHTHTHTQTYTRTQTHTHKHTHVYIPHRDIDMAEFLSSDPAIQDAHPHTVYDLIANICHDGQPGTVYQHKTGILLIWCLCASLPHNLCADMYIFLHQELAKEHIEFTSDIR